jgi:hypothetical protein
MYIASSRCIAVKMWLKCSCVLWVAVNVTISVVLYLVRVTHVFSFMYGTNHTANQNTLSVWHCGGSAVLLQFGASLHSRSQ